MLKNAVINKFCDHIARKYSGLSDIERENLVSDSLYAFATTDKANKIVKPFAWLCATAYRKFNDVRREREKDAKIHESAINRMGLCKYQHNQMLNYKWSDVEINEPGKLEIYRCDSWKRLPKLRKELISLVHCGGATITDAANMLGVNRSTAKSWISRDTKRLQADPGLHHLAFKEVAKNEVNEGSESKNDFES